MCRLESAFIDHPINQLLTVRFTANQQENTKGQRLLLSFLLLSLVENEVPKKSETIPSHK